MQLENANGDLSQLTTAFAQSEEAIKQYGSSDTVTHITQVYQQLFNRAPDAEGLAFWVNAVDQGHMSLADAAVKIQAGAQSTDMQLAQLREKLADQFTQKVADGEFLYSGYASLEAARVLVKAVSLEMSSADADAIVGFSLKLADIATKTPGVVDAISTGTTLAKLLDTARGAADPVKLVQALADVAEAAAGNPATLDSLLRSGGMQKVLEVMPAKATLGQVVEALAKGGLPAAVEIVYPTAPSIPTVPTPPPEFSVVLRQGVLTFNGTSSDAVVVDLTNNVITRNGEPVKIAGITKLNDVVANNYAGNVVVIGSVADVAKVMAVPSGVDFYEIVDVKSAFFNGVIGARALTDTLASLIDKAHTVTITDILSAEEMAVIEARASFELERLTAQVDSEAPGVGAKFDSITEGSADHVPDFGTNQAEITVTAVLDAALAEGDYVQYSIDGKTWTTVAATDVVGTRVSVKGIDATTSPTVSIRVVDAAGNPGQVIEQKITYDNTAATQTVTIDSITEDHGDTPDGKHDFVTNEKTATIQATLSDELAAGEYVQYSLDGELWTSLSTKDIDGTSVTIRDIDVSGSPALLVRVVDAFGNPGAEATQKIDHDGVGATQTVTIDAISEDQDASADSTPDFTTNQSTATVTATLSGVLAEGEYVQYSVNGQDWIELDADAVIGTAVTIEGINAATSPTLSVRVVDAAGNPGDKAIQAITFDDQGATQTVEFVSISEDKDDSADGTPDFTTNVASATVEAKLSAVLGKGEYVQYSVNGTDWITLAANAVNGQAVTIESIDTATTQKLQVRVVDAAGNEGVAASQDIVFDNEAATQTVAFRSISEDTKDSADRTADYVTNQAEITVTAELSAALGAGDYVQYSVDGSAWTKVDAKGIDGLLVSIKGINATTSPTVAFRVVDAAGNAGQETAQAITYDVSAATQTVTIDSISEDHGDTPDGNKDFVTNEKFVTVKATLSDVLADGEYVQYSVDGSNWIDSKVVRSSDFTVNLAPQVQITVDGKAVTIHDINVSGNPTLLVRVVDAAGNPGTQASQAIVYDHVAATQTVTIDTISQDTDNSADSTADFVTNKATATVTATLSAVLATGEYVQYSVNGQDWTKLAADAVSGQAVTIEGIDTTTSPTLSVRVVDAAGNEGATKTQKIDYDGVAATQTVIFRSISEDTDNSADRTADYTTNQATVTLKAELSAALAEGDYVQYSVDGTNWTKVNAKDIVGLDLSIAGINASTSPTVTFRVVDAAGNPGEETAQAITYDVSAATQTVTIDSISEDHGDTPDGNKDFVTNEHFVTVKATLSDVLADGEYVQYSLDGSNWVDSKVVRSSDFTVNLAPQAHITVDGKAVTIHDINVSGNPTLLVRVVDAAGNPGTQASQAIVYDHVAATQTVTIDTISQDTDNSADSTADFVTNKATATVTATLSAVLATGEYVQYSVNGQDWTKLAADAVIGQAVTIEGIDTTTSPTLQVRVVDAAGNEGATESQKIEFDGVDATQTVAFRSISEDTDNSADHTADYTTNQATITLKAELSAALATGDYVQYSVDGKSWTKVDAENIKGLDLSIKGIDATTSPTVTFRVVDAAGNPGKETEQAITYDVSAATQTVTIDSISEDHGDTPDGNKDFVTNEKLATVKATLSDVLADGEYVQYSLDGSNWIDSDAIRPLSMNINLVPQARISVEGKAVTIHDINVSGNPTLLVRVVDAAGNPGTQASQAIVYDRVAATQTVTIDAISQDTDDSADSTADFVTNKATATVTATLSAVLVTGEYVQYSVNGQDWTKLAADAVSGQAVTIEGIDTTTSPTLSVRVVDAAGNEGATETQKIEFDGVAATQTVVFRSISEDTDNSADHTANYTTNQATITLKAKLTAALETGDYVQYSVDGKTWTEVDAKDIVGLDLSIEGINASTSPTVTFRVVDAAGNAGEETAQAITYDVSAATQTVTIDSITEDEGDTPDGHEDFVTNQKFVTVSATLSDVLAAGEYVQYSLDGSNWIDSDAIRPLSMNINLVPEARITVDGKAVTIHDINVSGNPTLLVRVVDAAGNPGTQASQPIVFDNVAATQTVTIDAISEDTGASADSTPDFVTNQATATVTATLSDELATGEYVQYSVNGQDWTKLAADAISGTTVSIEGINTAAFPTLSVRVVDAAGNQGAEATQAIIFDNKGAAQTVEFVSISEDEGNSADRTQDFTTNVALANVEAKLSDVLGKGEYVQYSVNGTDWITLSADAVNGQTVTIEGINTATTPTLSVRVVDAAGNEGAVESTGIVFDDEAPTQTVTIESVSGGELDISPDFTTNQSSATIHATLSAELNDGEYVQYSIDGENWLENLAYLPRGPFGGHSMSGILVHGSDVTIYGVDVSDSPSVRVRIVDAAGNAGTPATQAITYDNVAPAISVTFDKISESDDDSAPDFTTNQWYANVEATLSSELGEGDYVQFSVDGFHWTTATVLEADRMSTFDMPDSRATIDGNALKIYGIDTTSSPMLLVRVIDAAGNFKEPAEQKITFDDQAPLNTVTIDAVSQDADDVSIDFTTNQQSATVTATLEKALETGERVQYSTDGLTWTSVAAEDVVGKVVTIADFDTTASPTLSLRLIDAAGNATTAVSKAITYDGEAPSVGDITFSQVTQGRGDLKLDNVTKVASAHVDFTYSGEGIGAGEQYQWSTDGKTWHTESIDVYTSTKTVRVKNVDLTKGTPVIAEGASEPVFNADKITTVYLRSIDAAGNKSTEVSQQIVYDHFAAKPTLSLATDSFGTNVGSNADHITNDATLSLLGVETGAKLEYSANGIDGWSTTEPSTVQGLNKYFVRQTDKANNTSEASEINFTLDNIKPTAPTISLDSDTGVSATDGITNKGVVNIAGLETNGSTIWEYSTDNGATWIKGEATDETGAAKLDLTALGDGVKAVVVRQVDLAGNVGDNSTTTVHFTLDTKSPDNTVYFSAVEEATTDANVTELKEARVFFKYTGTLDTSGKMEWRLKDGTWATVDTDAIDTVTKTIILGPLNLDNGHKTVELRQIDEAGNYNIATQLIKGPYSPGIVTTDFDVNGVYVTSSKSGTIVGWSDWYWNSDQNAEFGQIVKNDDATKGQLIGQGDYNGVNHPMLGYGYTIGVRETDTDTTWYDQSGRTYRPGSEFNDNLYGQHVWGFDGNDHIQGTYSNDFLSGGNGDDTIYGYHGADTLYGGDGADTFRYTNWSDSVESTNDVRGFDTIKDFEFGTDKIEFNLDQWDYESRIIARPNDGIVIDTTQYTTLDELVAAAQTYLADYAKYGSLVAGQVGKDVYILGDGEVSNPNQYDRGSDLLIKLENAKVQYLSIDDFTGLSGMHQYVGDLTAVDGITMPHSIDSINASVLMFVDKHGDGYAMGKIVVGEEEMELPQTSVAISSPGGDQFFGGEGDYVVIETPEATNLSKEWDLETDFMPPFDFIVSEGKTTIDFGVDVTSVAIRSGNITDRIVSQDEDESDSFVFHSSASMLAALNAAYQEAHGGLASAAILLNDSDTQLAMLAVDANGDGKIDVRDYALAGARGTVSVDAQHNIVYESVYEEIDDQEPVEDEDDGEQPSGPGIPGDNGTTPGTEPETGTIPGSDPDPGMFPEMPFPVIPTDYTPMSDQDGIYVNIAVSADVYIGSTLVTSHAGSPQTIGEQAAGQAVQGAFRLESNSFLSYDSENSVYALGSSTTDNLTGNFVWGFGGNDVLNGSNGIDHLYGGEGDDALRGNGGGDEIDASEGHDHVMYSMASDSNLGELDGLRAYDIVTVASTGTSLNFGRDVNINAVDMYWNPNDWGTVDGALDSLNDIFQAHTARSLTQDYEALLIRDLNQAWLVVDTGNGNIGSEDYVIKIVGNDYLEISSDIDGVLIEYGILPP